MRTLGKILKFLILMAILGIIGLGGFSLVSELRAPQQEVIVEIPVPAGQ
ncbi:MAG: hypothetical protein AAGD47_04630 [Pseudomonadota bacterium]